MSCFYIKDVPNYEKVQVSMLGRSLNANLPCGLKAVVHSMFQVVSKTSCVHSG